MEIASRQVYCIESILFRNLVQVLVQQTNKKEAFMEYHKVPFWGHTLFYNNISISVVKFWNF